MKRSHFILTVLSLFLIIFILTNFSHSETPSQYLLDEKVQTSECSDQFTEQEHFMGNNAIIYHCVKTGAYTQGQPIISISFLNFSVYSCSPFQGDTWFTDSQGQKVLLCTNLSSSTQDSPQVSQSVFTESSCESLNLVLDNSFQNSEGKTISHCISQSLKDNFIELTSSNQTIQSNPKINSRAQRKIVCSVHETKALCNSDTYCTWDEGTSGSCGTGRQPSCIDNPNVPPEYIIPDPTNINKGNAKFNYQFDEDLTVNFTRNSFNNLLLVIEGKEDSQYSKTDSTEHCAVTLFPHSQQICIGEDQSTPTSPPISGILKKTFLQQVGMSSNYKKACVYEVSCIDTRGSASDPFVILDDIERTPTNYYLKCSPEVQSELRDLIVYAGADENGNIHDCQRSYDFIVIDIAGGAPGCSQGPTKWYGLKVEEDSFGNSKISRINSGSSLTEKDIDSSTQSFFDECWSHYGHEEPKEVACGNGNVDTGEQCDNGRKCCNDNGECEDIVHDCSSDYDCTFVYKDLHSAQQYNYCIHGGGDGCSDNCQTCASEDYDNLIIYPTTYSDFTCTQETRYLQTGKTTGLNAPLPANMNYKCFPTTNYNKDSGIVTCDTLVGYRSFPGSGSFIYPPTIVRDFNGNIIPNGETTGGYESGLKIEYSLRYKQKKGDCFSEKVLIGKTPVQPAVPETREALSNILSQPTFFVFGDPIFYPYFTIDNSVILESKFRPFSPLRGLGNIGWTYGYGLYWAHQKIDIKQTSAYNSQIGNPESVSCYVKVFDGNNVLFTSGSNSEPCNYEPDVIINPSIIFDSTSPTSPSYLEFTIKDDSSDPTSVSIDNLDEFRYKVYEGPGLSFDGNSVKGVKVGQTARIPVDPKKFKQPRQITLTVKDNGFGSGGKNCDDIKTVKVTQQVSLPTFQDPSSPERRLMPIENFQFEIKKLGELSRGAKSQTTLERYYDLDSDKLAGIATTFLIEEYAQPLPVIGEDIIRDNIGNGVASSYAANLRSSGVLSESTIKEIQTAIAPRMRYQGNSIRVITSDGKVRVILSGKDSKGSPADPIVLGPYPITDQNKMLQTPTNKSEMTDYGQNGGSSKEFISLKIISAPGSPEAGGGWANKNLAPVMMEEIETLYDKYIYNPTNPSDNEAFFNRINNEYKNIQQKIKE